MDEETILINRIKGISTCTAVSTADIIRQYDSDNVLKQLLQDVKTGRQSEMIKILLMPRYSQSWRWWRKLSYVEIEY